MGFVEELKTAREKLNLAQWEAAKLIGIPKRTLEAWEMGERVPPEHVQRMTLYVFDVVRAQLLAGELRADLMYSILEPETKIFIIRDERGYIIDWVPPLDSKEMRGYTKISAAKALEELEYPIPYFSEAEAEFLFKNFD